MKKVKELVLLIPTVIIMWLCVNNEVGFFTTFLLGIITMFVSVIVGLLLSERKTNREIKKVSESETLTKLKDWVHRIDLLNPDFTEAYNLGVRLVLVLYGQESGSLREIINGIAVFAYDKAYVCYASPYYTERVFQGENELRKIFIDKRDNYVTHYSHGNKLSVSDSALIGNAFGGAGAAMYAAGKAAEINASGGRTLSETVKDGTYSLHIYFGNGLDETKIHAAYHLISPNRICKIEEVSTTIPKSIVNDVIKKLEEEIKKNTK